MRILADHCVWGKTIRFLKDNDFKVIRLKEVGNIASSDEEVLQIAHRLDVILVTNDLDFGDIRRYPPGKHQGIIVLRITTKNIGSVHLILLQFLNDYGRERIRGKLAIINSKSCRIRS